MVITATSNSSEKPTVIGEATIPDGPSCAHKELHDDDNE